MGRSTSTLFQFWFLGLFHFRWACRTSGRDLVLGTTLGTTPPIEILIPCPPDHLDSLPTKQQPDQDGRRCIDPPTALPNPEYQRAGEQDDGELHAGEGAEGFAVEGARVEGAGEVAFGEVESEHEECGGGGDEQGGEGGGGAVVCCEGGGRGGDRGEGEGNEESANGGRCDAFKTVGDARWGWDWVSVIGKREDSQALPNDLWGGFALVLGFVAWFGGPEEAPGDEEGRDNFDGGLEAVKNECTRR